MSPDGLADADVRQESFDVGFGQAAASTPGLRQEDSRDIHGRHHVPVLRKRILRLNESGPGLNGAWWDESFSLLQLSGSKSVSGVDHRLLYVT
jgi:hypothetical protein